MLSRNTDPFPFEEVRDLLGVCRAIYAAEQARGAPPGVLVPLAQVGESLRIALELAEAHRDRRESMGHYAAWKRALEATRRLGDVIDSLMAAEPMVSAAARRVALQVRARRR